MFLDILSFRLKDTIPAIKFQGGAAADERLSKSRILKRMLKEQDSAKRIYGAVCSSPAVLFKQGLLKDKRAIAHPSLETESTYEVNAAKVIIDGKLITSKGFYNVIDFALAIVSKLFGHARARSVAEGLVFEYPRAG
ncbi:Protein DJ-1-like C, partial [Cucurbita argyrosperma subsp. argyrosperma]